VTEGAAARDLALGGVAAAERRKVRRRAPRGATL